jgi:hypothetical protein
MGTQMDSNDIATIALWALQVLLALAFLAGGILHAFRFDRFAAMPRMAWANDVGRTNMRVIGLLEIAGAIGLVLPAATGILPWLTVVAAAGLALVMAGALVFHLRRGEPILANAILGGLALVIVVGRLVVAPFPVP